MSKKRNAHPSAATLEQAGKNYVNGISRNDYIRKPVAGQFKIPNFLNAATAADTGRQRM